MAVAFSPLYLTALHDAVFDGALLVISIGFPADALFRLIDPLNKKQGKPPTIFFMVGTILLLILALLQYDPIANDLRRERIAGRRTLDATSIEPLRRFQEEREEDEENLPNSSYILLLAGVIAEFGVMICLES